MHAKHMIHDTKNINTSSCDHPDRTKMLSDRAHSHQDSLTSASNASQFYSPPAPALTSSPSLPTGNTQLVSYTKIHANKVIKTLKIDYRHLD